MIRPVTLADAQQIARIYNHYIAESVVTFEEKTLSDDEMEQRIAAVVAKGRPYIVCETDGVVAGYAYLDTWRSRSAFDITMETSIYLAPGAQGKGMGTELYAELIRLGREAGFRSLIGVVSLPNDVSSHIHRKAGFELIGTFREVGRKFGQLIDVEFWQLRY